MKATEVDKKTASAALQHPIRVQVLVALNERSMSPRQFVDEVVKPRSEAERKRKLSFISYHFRALADAGCVEVIEEIPRRGSIEHVYRCASRAYFSDDEWAAMSLPMRCRISTTMLQGLIAEAENAMLAGTFDSQDDRWLAWNRAEMDDRGWAEMTTALAANFAELERIREDAEARLAANGGADAIPVTYGLLGFEAPKRPGRRGD